MALDQSETLEARLAVIPPRRLSNKLRAAMPEIDRRVREGVEHDEIVALLNASGFDMSLGAFRKRLYRWRRKESLAAGDHHDAGRGAQPLHVEPADFPKPSPRPRSQPPIEDRSELADVLDRARRNEIGDEYLARQRPILKSRK